MEKVTAKEAAKFLGISRSTLNRRVASGKLKPLNEKTPGQERIPAYFFARTDVEKLAEPKK